jgi:hypothetical protein
MNLQMDRIRQACEVLKLNTVALEWPAIADCNGQVKPDTFLGSLAVIIPFKFQRCFVPQF